MKVMHKLCLLSVLPFLAIILSIIFVSNHQSESILRLRIMESTNLELNFHSKRIEDFFLKKVDELKLIGSTPVVQRGNIQEILRYFEREQKRLSRHIEGIYYNDLEGTVYDVAGGTFSVRDRYYFPQISRDGVVITKVINSRATQKPIVLMLVPIFDIDGKRTGAVGGTILVKDLLQMIIDIKVGHSGFAIMVDENDRVISSFGKPRYPEKDPYFMPMDVTSSPESMRHLIRTMRYLDDNTTRVVYDEFSYLAFFKPIKTIGWSLVLMYKESEVLADLKQMNTLYVLMCLCGSIALCLFTYGTKRIVLDPIQTLVKVQQRFGEGDLTARSKNTAPGEFGALSSSFNNMADQLSERTTKLEKEVLERKLAEEALSESEEKYRLFVESANEGIILTQNGLLRYMNPRAIEFMEFSEEDLISQDLTKFIHPDDKDSVIELYVSKMDGENVLPGSSFRIINKSGNTKWVESRSVVLNWKGKPSLLSFLIDTTERKRAEEALRQEREKFMVLIEESPFGISYIGKDGRYKYINPKFNEIFGYALKDIPTGKIWFEKAFPKIKYRQKVISTWLSDLKQHRIGESRPRTFSVACKDGTEKTIYFKPVTMKNGDQFVIHEDVTRRIQLEDQLRQSQKMEALGTLAGGIAHDFNNILSPLLGYAEMLKEDLSADSPFQASVNEILRASFRARDLVQQILAFSRQTEDDLKPLKIHSSVNEAIKLLCSSLPKTIDIEQNIDSNCGAVLADSTQIHQIVMNLATNAYHAMEDSGGTLKLTLKQVHVLSDELKFQECLPGTYACLTVTDTGTGIEKDILDRIFEPYFTTKGKDKGTGLGLSVVHGIVKGWGGDIHIVSEPGKRTEVAVYLPIIASKVEENVEESSGAIQGGMEKILLVDDEEAIVRMEQRMLEQLGYTVTTRTGSVDALEAFRANPSKYDLIITDMTMPNMTGIRLSKEIRKIEPAVPIIICTGFSDQINDDNCKAFGIQGYVMKPIVRKEFAGIIREVLDRRVVS